MPTLRRRRRRRRGRRKERQNGAPQRRHRPSNRRKEQRGDLGGRHPASAGSSGLAPAIRSTASAITASKAGRVTATEAPRGWRQRNHRLVLGCEHDLACSTCRPARASPLERLNLLYTAGDAALRDPLRAEPTELVARLIDIVAHRQGHALAGMSSRQDRAQPRTRRWFLSAQPRGAFGRGDAAGLRRGDRRSVERIAGAIRSTLADAGGDGRRGHHAVPYRRFDGGACAARTFWRSFPRPAPSTATSSAASAMGLAIDAARKSVSEPAIELPGGSPLFRPVVAPPTAAN